MGGFKNKQYEGLKEVQENSEQTKEVGTEMTEDAEEISSILEGINLQDEDDMESISETKSGYSGSFDTAFASQVEMATRDIEKTGEGIQSEVGAEMENVSEGISALQDAEGISEIGSENAEGGKAGLEQSKAEYQEIFDDTAETTSDIRGVVDDLGSRLEGLFG